MCSKHFREEDYLTPPGQPNPRLKINAVPSFFDFPLYLQAVVKQKRREIKKVNNVEPGQV